MTILTENNDAVLAAITAQQSALLSFIASASNTRVSNSSYRMLVNTLSAKVSDIL